MNEFAMAVLSEIKIAHKALVSQLTLSSKASGGPALIGDCFY